MDTSKDSITLPMDENQYNKLHEFLTKHELFEYVIVFLSVNNPAMDAETIAEYSGHSLGIVRYIRDTFKDDIKELIK